MRVIPVGGSAPCTWQGRPVRLGDEVARCVQQVVEDDVFSVGGRVCLPVKLEGQFGASQGISDIQIMAEQADAAQLTGRSRQGSVAWIATPELP